MTSDTELLPVDPELAAFYGSTEIPETEVVGWLLDVPANEIIGDNRELKEEVVEWCDMNLREKYWLFFPMVIDEWRWSRSNFRERAIVQMNFSTERDFILFKMRWT